MVVIFVVAAAFVLFIVVIFIEGVIAIGSITISVTPRIRFVFFAVAVVIPVIAAGWNAGVFTVIIVIAATWVVQVCLAITIIVDTVTTFGDIV